MWDLLERCLLHLSPAGVGLLTAGDPTRRRHLIFHLGPDLNMMFLKVKREKKSCVFQTVSKMSHLPHLLPHFPESYLFSGTCFSNANVLSFVSSTSLTISCPFVSELIPTTRSFISNSVNQNLQDSCEQLRSASSPVPSLEITTMCCLFARARFVENFEFALLAQESHLVNVSYKTLYLTTLNRPWLTPNQQPSGTNSHDSWITPADHYILFYCPFN